MAHEIESRLRAIGPELRGLRRGIEKESLRVARDGSLAMTPHPVGLGSPLTHPHITTDFSESQLELITAPHVEIGPCLEELTHIHQFVYRHIGDEVLWCASMPGELPEEDAIPIAQYGSSNIARAKTVYRVGLAHRYGRRMQTVSGIHYNFSLPDSAWSALHVERNEGYFSLIRNFRRHAWLLVYLLGASPAVCASFAQGRAHDLQPLGADTLYAPYATSLRMGRLGYQSDAQASIAVSYNALEQYATALEQALTRPHPDYEAIGLRDGDSYRQLATTLLQIENEFYGVMRPKRNIRRGERPLHALRARGVQYVEGRLFDLDPFSPIGLTAATGRLLDVFMLHCALADSAPDTPQELAEIARNQHRVAARGREPGLTLERHGQAVAMRDWGLALLDACAPIAAALDTSIAAGHAEALSAAVNAVHEPALLPSARMLDEMKERHDGSYAKWALAQSLRHAHALKSAALSETVERGYALIAEDSLSGRREIEAADTLSFESFRRRYVSHARLRV